MKNNKGFSLVELIVVIAIMAILAAVAVVSFNIYIQKAKEANDEEYRSNVEYFALLEATEHQFELYGDKVVLEDIVDGPEDIKLIVAEPSGQVIEYTIADEAYAEIIQDIFNAVGKWTFSYACLHEGAAKTTVPANCVDGEHLLYSCCGHKEYISHETNDNNHAPVSDEEKAAAPKHEDGYYHIYCKWCHSIVLYAEDPTLGLAPVGKQN